MSYHYLVLDSHPNIIKPPSSSPQCLLRRAVCLCFVLFVTFAASLRPSRSHLGFSFVELRGGHVEGAHRAHVLHHSRTHLCRVAWCQVRSSQGGVECRAAPEQDQETDLYNYCIDSTAVDHIILIMRVSGPGFIGSDWTCRVLAVHRVRQTGRFGASRSGSLQRAHLAAQRWRPPPWPPETVKLEQKKKLYFHPFVPSSVLAPSSDALSS